MKKLLGLAALMIGLLAVEASHAQTVGSATPISQLPYGGLLLPSDQVVANRSATTMRMVPFQMPATGSVMISNGTLAPSGILPVNGECLVGTGSAWVAQTCPGSSGSGVTWPNSDDIVVSNSSDAPLGLAPTDTDVLIGNGSAWQQKAFSGDCTLADTGAITCTESNGVAIVTTTGTQTLTNKSIDGSEINSGTVSHTYLPTGSGSAPGILQCGTNTSCSTGTISVPAGTSSAQGALECGTNTSCSGGTISVPTGSSSTAGVLQCGNGTSCSGGTISALTATSYTNYLSSDVTMTNSGTFYDGPSIAQGTSGTWFVCGTITVGNTSTLTGFNIELYDGTTTYASAVTDTNTSTLEYSSKTLCAIVANPSGNLRLAAAATQNNSVIKYNESSLGHDSQIQAVRIR